MKLFNSHYLLRALVITVIVVLCSCSDEQDEEFSERTKIALRDVGNNLLLKINDSTSLIKPVVEIKPKTFQLSFDSQLSFEPTELVSYIKQSIEAVKLPEFYRVEVIQCSDKEVAYSYQITADEESTIVPCGGRVLPNACYFIQVNFNKNLEVPFTRQGFFFGYVFLIVVLLTLYFYKKRQALLNDVKSVSFSIGSFKFYPEESKLVKATDEINLSKKECELLEIFVTNTNTIVKRDELTKRVWEDHGVIVGRSLDTYVSKLRKKAARRRFNKTNQYTWCRI